MRLNVLVAFACLLGLALAGCSGKGPADSTSSSTSSSKSSTPTSSHTQSSTHTGTGATGNGTTNGTTANNHAPTGSISAAVNGTKATFTLHGQDSDGDALAWNLTFGDGAQSNGTGLPATVNHTFAASGNYTANFTLTDGKAQAIYNVTIAVTAGGATATQDASGSTKASAAGCGPGILGLVGQGQDYAGDQLDGVEWVRFDVVPGTIGKAFAWSEDPTSPAIAGSFIAFYDSGNGYIDEDFTGAGTVPDGSSFAVFYACGPGPDSFTYHAG